MRVPPIHAPHGRRRCHGRGDTDQTSVVSSYDDPGRYGSSFADVYDLWYPGGDEGEVVALLSRHLRHGARILELGVGTGRLALGLSAAGFEVVGLDASPEMLAVMAAKKGASSVPRVVADAARPATWPAAGLHGTFDCVLAACNLLLNLPSPDAQREALRGAVRHLDTGGILAVELQEISAPRDGEVDFGLSDAGGGTPVVISTETDPCTGAVEGRHIELPPDGGARVRPWSVCPLELTTLDRWCGEAGLHLLERHGSWSGEMWDPDSHAPAVSVYHRP